MAERVYRAPGTDGAPLTPGDCDAERAEAHAAHARRTAFRAPKLRTEAARAAHARMVVHTPEVMRCALHNAVAEGDVEKVKSCEAAGASLEWRDEAPGALGMACVHLAVVAAAAHANAAPAPRTKDVGADGTSAAATYNRDAHAHGTREDRLELLRYLLDDCKLPVDVCDYVEATPLHCAAALGDAEVVRTLCRHGASVRTTDAEGLTPLHLACNNGHADAVQALVDCWAPLEAAEDVPEPPTDTPKRGAKPPPGGVAPVGASLYVARRGTPLHVAVASDRPAIVRLLACAGANVNSASGPHDATPLHIAARCGFAEVVRELLEHGADANVRDNLGDTPLMRAVEGEHEGIVELLLGRGADAGARSDRGLTSLHIAAACGRSALFAPLVAGGAQVDARTTSMYEDYDGGRTPLHYAAHNGDAACFAELRRLGGDPRAASLVGWTPLFYAVEAGVTNQGRPSEAHLALVEDLIAIEKEHADDAAPYPYPTVGAKHRTPLMVAVLQGWMEGVRLLATAWPAMVHHADGDGRTAMHWGATRCEERVLQVLHDEFGARGDVRDSAGKMPGDLWSGTVKPAPRRQWEEPRRGALNESTWDYTAVMEHTAFEYTKKALAARRPRAIAQEKQCLHCLRFAFDAKRCAACKQAFYCSVDCQKAHWPEHKLICRTLFVDQ